MKLKKDFYFHYIFFFFYDLFYYYFFDKIYEEIFIFNRLKSYLFYLKYINF
jgi:hypothetical protein